MGWFNSLFNKKSAPDDEEPPELLLTSDFDDWFTIKTEGPVDPRTGKKTFSQEQIKDAILKAVNEKGWHTLYFCNSETKINDEVTRMAQEILRQMIASGEISQDAITISETYPGAAVAPGPPQMQ